MAAHDPLAVTLTCRTGGGWHYYFRHPGVTPEGWARTARWSATAALAIPAVRKAEV